MSNNIFELLVCYFYFSRFLGHHWVYEMVYMLMQGVATRVEHIKETRMIEIMTKNDYEEADEPRLFNTHMYFHHLPTEFTNKKCKIIYLLRNPKDVAVSFYNHHFKLCEYGYNGSWDTYLPRLIKGQGRCEFGEVQK